MTAAEEGRADTRVPGMHVLASSMEICPMIENAKWFQGESTNDVQVEREHPRRLRRDRLAGPGVSRGQQAPTGGTAEVVAVMDLDTGADKEWAGGILINR